MGDNSKRKSDHMCSTNITTQIVGVSVKTLRYNNCPERHLIMIYIKFPYDSQIFARRINRAFH